MCQVESPLAFLGATGSSCGEERGDVVPHGGVRGELAQGHGALSDGGGVVAHQPPLNGEPVVRDAIWCDHRVQHDLLHAARRRRVLRVASHATRLNWLQYEWLAAT